MRLPSASRLQLARTCLGSAVLPQADHVNEHASRGTAIHRYLQRANEIGVEPALAEVEDEQFRAVCAAIDLDGLPLDPAAYAPEVAFAWSWQTGAARELGRGLERDYSAATDDEIVGTDDVSALLGDDATYGGDFKTGFGHVSPPATNWQRRALALMKARAWGRHRSVEEIIRPREDGPAWRLRAEFDAFDLAAIAEELRELAQEIIAARAAYAAGTEPPLVLGEHCKYCPAVDRCPAQTAQLVQLGTAPDIAERFGGALTPELSRLAYQRLKAADEAVKRMWAHLETFAKVHPVDLGDGRWYEPVEQKRDTLTGRIVLDVLTERYGLERAWDALEIKATKAAITDLARAEAQEKKRKIVHVTDEIFGELTRRGGLTSFTHETVREHKRKKGAA